MNLDRSLEIFDETDKLILGHMHEDAVLTIKATGENIFLEYFYGDPECGIISENNEWCIVGGNMVVVWLNGDIRLIEDSDLCCIYGIRQTGEYTAELLKDPWMPDSAIWELDVRTLGKKKLREFPNYRDKEYEENVEW